MKQQKYEIIKDEKNYMNIFNLLQMTIKLLLNYFIQYKYYNKLQKSYNHIITSGKVMSSEISDHQNNSYQAKKKKRGESRTSKDQPKYQCYCDKIYLSYPALYLHLKNKHPQCFMNNRKIQVTKFKESLSLEGFKILKMEKQKIQAVPQQNYQKHQPTNNYPGYDHFPFPTKPNYGMPSFTPQNYFSDQKPLMSKGLMQNPTQNMYALDSSREKSERQSKNILYNQSTQNKSNIIDHLNTYFKSLQHVEAINPKQKLQLEVIYSLLLKCIKEKSSTIKSLYQLQTQPIESYDCTYISSILHFFTNTYLLHYIKQNSTKNPQLTNKTEKLTFSLIKVSKYFTNLQNAKKQILRFQNWLLKNDFIQKVEPKNLEL